MKSTKERTMNFISSTEHEARLFPHKATKTTSLEKKKKKKKTSAILQDDHLAWEGALLI